MGQIRRFALNLGKAKILKFKKTSGKSHYQSETTRERKNNDGF